LPPLDEIERMRRELLRSVQAMHREQMRLKPEGRDPERIRRIARALKEVRGLSRPSAQRPSRVSPIGATLRPAGPLLAEHRASAGAPAAFAPASVSDPEPAPVAETVEERFRRETSESIERAMQRQAEESRGDQRSLVAQSMLADHREADESRGRRRREPPAEDLSSVYQAEYGRRR
jgi:hypothetical protein